MCRLNAYFAYGANMDEAAMARRCPGARLVGPAELARHRFAIVRGGHGTVRRSARASVHGVLWRLGGKAEAALDRYEEVARGLYRRERRLVLCRGRRIRALVYIASSAASGAPRPAYVGAIEAAARRWGFPADYVAALSAIARTSAGVRPSSRNAASVAARSRFA
jgi:hypothetical protein